MITSLLQFLNQIKICHWQTDTYHEHIIFDDLYKDLSSSVDELVETLFGQGYERNIQTDEQEIVLANYDSIDPLVFFDDFKNLLGNVKQKYPQQTNIVDTMIDNLNKSIYLLSLQ